MTTTLRIAISIDTNNAHEDLTEITGIVQTLIDRFDSDHAGYAGVELRAGPINDRDGMPIGSWELTSTSKTRKDT